MREAGRDMTPFSDCPWRSGDGGADVQERRSILQNGSGALRNYTGTT